MSPFTVGAGITLSDGNEKGGSEDAVFKKQNRDRNYLYYVVSDYLLCGYSVV